MILLLSFSLIGQELVSFRVNEHYSVNALLDERTGTPKQIIGLRDHIRDYGYEKEEITENVIKEIGSKVIDRYSDLLKIYPEDILIKNIDTDGEWWFVEYQQVFEGILVEHSDVGFTINPDGYIVTLGGRIYPDIPPQPQSAILSDNALTIASQRFDADTVEVRKGPQLVECLLNYFKL